MKPYRVLYTATARDRLRELPALVKPAIKKLIENVASKPYSGKLLRSDLAGYDSARVQRWRIIYSVEREEQRVVIHLIEKRVSVYESLKGMKV